PCIRGHRSSKCNHSDRVLVQVRKPGRPLSSCPHTLAATSDSRSTITSPTSPTFPAILSASSANNGPSSRIVKPQRPKKNGQARKGSVNIGEVALEQLIEQEREGSSSSAESLKMENTASSCGGMPGCGGNSVQQSQPRPQHYIHCAPVPQNTQQGPSCCNNPKKAITIQTQQMAVSQIPFSGNSFFPALQYPSSYIPPTNFSQVSNMWMYPTIHPAITPQEFAWLQQQRAAGVFGPQPTAQLPGHVALASPMSNPPVTNTTLAHGWEHNCHCGPECNCLGCATHPFNRRTVEHVREMQSFMAVDDGSLSPQSHLNPTNHNHPHSLVQQLSHPQPQQDSFEANGMSLSSPVAGAPPGTCCGSKSSPAKQISPTTEEEDIGPDGTPTGTPSGTDAVDELSPSNFLYFDYPLGVCAQTEAGCKCGEGCTCVGCITHGGHDGVELEAPVQAPEWEAWEIEEDT
ncbi:hypothetical protein DFP73DRAFT_480624, partial [Morchella snyderi]